MTVDLHLCPGLPLGDGDAPVFAEPWQAHAFAITLQLYGRGVFTWSEWAQALGGQIRRAQAGGDADLGDTYYGHWLAALEELVAAKGASTQAELARYAAAWHHAADRTPHGRPIVLQPQDFAATGGVTDPAGPPR
jgi:nitrile hydratase accessory protein